MWSARSDPWLGHVAIPESAAREGDRPPPARRCAIPGLDYAVALSPESTAAYASAR